MGTKVVPTVSQYQKHTIVYGRLPACSHVAGKRFARLGMDIVPHAVLGRMYRLHSLVVGAAQEQKADRGPVMLQGRSIHPVVDTRLGSWWHDGVCQN